MIANPQVGQRVWWAEVGTIVEIHPELDVFIVRDSEGKCFAWSTDKFFASRKEAADKIEQEEPNEA